MVKRLQTNIVEFKNIYEDCLKKINYNSPKDIKINAIQTALMLLNINKPKSSKFKLGYWCTLTEDVLNNFREMLSIKRVIGIDKKTWETLFDEVEKKCDIKMLYNKDNESIILENVAKYYESKKRNDDIKNMSFFSNNNRGYFNNGKTLEYPIRNMANYGEDWDSYIPPRPTFKGNKTLSPSDRIFDMNYGKNFMNQDISLNNNYGSFFGIVNREVIDSEGKEYIDGPAYTISDSGIEFGDKYLDHKGMQDVDLNYDFAYNLLANSVYSGNQDVEKNKKWYTYVDTDGENKIVNLKESEKNETYFNNNKSAVFKKRNFDISIKYGVANSKIFKIIKNVIPRSVTQEINASGEPIYEVIEFIAQDVLEEIN